MAVLDVSLGTACEILLPMWQEVVFAMAFSFGFVLFRCDKLGPGGGGRRNSPTNSPRTSRSRCNSKASEDLHSAMEAAMLAEDHETAAKTWRDASAKEPTNLKTLRLAAQALVASSPHSVAEELVGHMGEHHMALGNAAAAAAVLDAVAAVGNPATVEDVHVAIRDRLSIRPSTQVVEALLGGLAAAGASPKRIAELCAEMQASKQRISPRGYSLVIKNFLKRGLVDAALSQMGAMRKEGYFVPPFAMTLLAQKAAEAGCLVEVLSRSELCGVSLPAEALVLILDDCCKRGDVALASHIEESQRQFINGGSLPPQCYGPLLKTFTAAGSPHALELWEEFVRIADRASEGLCMALLIRCADARFLRLAEEVSRYLRSNGEMSVAMYSVLMKVYASCGFHGRACDLYQDMLHRGIEPDEAMYASLMRMAAECGRTDLSRELFRKAPRLEMHSATAVFKALSRDKDADGAFALLQKMKATDEELDITVYNCVLDVCVCAGELDRARALLSEMRSAGPVDIVTYNTMLKGFCSKGDLESARAMLHEMERDGCKPNDISYNSMINAAASAGNSQQAWRLIDAMQKQGISVDRYTLTIMLKAMRRDNEGEVRRTFQLLDGAGIDVCSEEVLLNTVLETCVRHGELRRLATVVEAAERSPSLMASISVHTCAAMIKAYSALHRPQRCVQLWELVVRQRALEPNAIALGCMLDALVCAGRVDDAVTLFHEWKSRFVGAATIMYSTLIKGFASAGRAKEAMDMWREIRALGVQLNVVTYNTLINAQVRQGCIAEASQLLASMEPDGVVPDAITYSTLAKGYAMRGDLDEAFEVFRKMRRNGLAKESVVYNTLLDGCTRHNRMDLADIVIEYIERDKIEPSNFTLGILVKMYGKRRQLDRAFEVFNRMPAQVGFEPNAQVLTCLMNACIINGALSRAWEVFGWIQASAEGVDAKACGVLLNGCVRAGYLEQAMQLVEDAYGLHGRRRLLPSGQHLAADNVHDFLRALAQRGLGQQTVDVLAQLRDVGVPLNGRLLSSLLDGGVAAGSPQLRGARPQRRQLQS